VLRRWWFGVALFGQSGLGTPAFAFLDFCYCKLLRCSCSGGQRLGLGFSAMTSYVLILFVM